MTAFPPHKTLMLLHRLVDRSIAPLLEPMGLEHATEGYVTVARSDLDALMGAGPMGSGDPQAVLAGFGPRAGSSGLLVAEPSFSSAVLSRIWRSDRNEGAPLTHVEGEILRQFLARLVGAWADSWASEGIRLIPEFTMAGSLSMLQSQLDDGRWHIARTVVREPGSDQPLGVLLFCYPEALMPQLADEARSTMWRSRIARGLTDPERMRLSQRLGGSLRDVVITAPTILRQHMTLGMLNELERGDVIAFDEDHEGAISVEMLGREVSGRLAAHGDRLAMALTGPDHAGQGDDGPPDEMAYHDGGQSAPDYGMAYDTQPPIENPEFLAG